MHDGVMESSTAAEIPAATSERRPTGTHHAALESLVELIEHELPHMRGSILLVDEHGRLRHGAAPSLRTEYCRSIDGLAIGPRAGSCGTAAYRREQVIVGDIATDPLWEEYRDLALPFGLRACWSTPILDARGDVIGTFAMYYDEPRMPTARELELTHTATILASNIIQRARAEEALRERELQLRAAHAEADRANRAKADFLAMMSHELRTPLNAIGGYAQLMLDGIPSPATDVQQDYLQRIVKAQQHLLSLIDAVLTHAKLEAGSMSYQLEDVRIGELLETVESLTGPQLAAKEIAYDSSGCDGRIVVRADRRKAAQILLNLLSNAIKFTPSGGRVTVRTDLSEPGRVRIAVRDTGVGMTAEQVAAVFEPYTQFDNSLSREQKGTGLGMPISRELARGMGGDLTVESEPGVGTEFELTLQRGEGVERAD